MRKAERTFLYLHWLRERLAEKREAGEEVPELRLGLIADVQYADKDVRVKVPPRALRYRDGVPRLGSYNRNCGRPQSRRGGPPFGLGRVNQLREVGHDALRAALHGATNDLY